MASTRQCEDTGKNSSGPVAKVNNGKDVPVSKNQRPQSVTFQERENAAEQTANETFNRKKASSTKATDKEPSSGGQVAESVKNVARIPHTNSMHGHNKEKQGQEGTHHTDRHRAREGTSKHRHHQRDIGMRRYDRHHGSHHRSKRPHNGAADPREHHRHHLSNREHERFENANQNRAEEYRHQRRPIVSEQSNQRPKVHNDRNRSHSATNVRSSVTTTSLFKATISTTTSISTPFQVGAREGTSPVESDHSSSTTNSMYSNSFSNGEDMGEVSSQMNTQEYVLASVIEHHPFIDSSYFEQLQQQEKRRHSGRSPSEMSATVSPTGSPKSAETTVISGQHHGHSTVTSHSTSAHPLEKSWRSVSRSTHRYAPSHGAPQQTGRLSIGTIAPTGLTRSPTETGVISGSPHGSPTVTSHSTSTHPLANSWPSVSYSTHHHAPSQGTPHQTGTSSRRSPAETAVISGLPRGPSTVTSPSTSTHPLERSWPLVSHSTHHHASSQGLRHQAGKVSTERTATIALTGSPTSPTETAVISGSPRGPTAVASQYTSRFPLEMSRPSGSYSIHQRAPSRGIPKTSAVSSTPFSQPSSSTLLNTFKTARLNNQQINPAGDHSLGNRRSTVIGELDPRAEQAANAVRQRHPPVKPTPVIPATEHLFRGQSRRTARVASGDAGTSTLRARANVDGPAQKRKEGNGSSRNKAFKKKMSENFRGRKNWNS